MKFVSKVIIIFCLFLCSIVFSQSEKVVIHEKEQGKRMTLLAENKTADTLNIFLMVHSEGYRRSADKPVLTNLPPNTTVPIITLIKLTNATASYTYDLIINEEENNVHIAYEKDAIDISKVLIGKVVLFRLAQCPKCDVLEAMLDEQRIQHKVFNVEKDPTIYSQFSAFIDKETPQEVTIRYPVIWNKDRALFGYDDLEILLSQFSD